MEQKPNDYIPARFEILLERFVPVGDLFTTEVERADWRRRYYMRKYGKMDGRRLARSEETLMRRHGKLKSVPELAD